MLKNKIFTILPYWLICLTLILAVRITVQLYATDYVSVEIKPTPQVLGESISLRGDFLPKPADLSATADVNLTSIGAKSFLVFDAESGKILLEQNSRQKLPIASLTKLMTALVAYQNADLNKSFNVSPASVLKVSPYLGLKAKDSVKALDIFNAMIIGSCNDAAKALANYVATVIGGDFVDLMNNQAKNLGMENTEFSNPMGFDSPRNYSTAEDLKKLILQTQKLSVFEDLGRRINYAFVSDNNIPYKTVATNKLITSHTDIVAIKTGYTNEAHGAMATKNLINGHQIVILVLESPNRESDTLKLKSLVEQNFR